MADETNVAKMLSYFLVDIEAFVTVMCFLLIFIFISNLTALQNCLLQLALYVLTLAVTFLFGAFTLLVGQQEG